MAGELCGPLALAGQALFNLDLLLLPLLDQQREPRALFGKRLEIVVEPIALLGDRLAKPCEFAEIDNQPFGLLAHFGQHRPEQDRRAQGLQGILGPHHDGRRRMAADSLQGCEHLDDHPLPGVE